MAEWLEIIERKDVVLNLLDVLSFLLVTPELGRTQCPFENGHGWAMRRMRSAPMLTWIMALDTSQHRS